jgi:phosphoglycolate phosphatase
VTRYRLAIFDFDGTLADSLPWFRASFQDMITRFDLAPVRDDEVEGLRGLSAREMMARSISMWQSGHVSDMRKRKLAATRYRYYGIRRCWLTSSASASDRHRQLRQRGLGPAGTGPAALITGSIAVLRCSASTEV